MPNGVITRYEVDLGGAVMPLPADRFFIVTSEEQQRVNVPARVCCASTLIASSLEMAYVASLRYLQLFC